MKEMTEKMKPCPFCGGEDLIIQPDMSEDDNETVIAYHVFCRRCHAKGRNNYPISWCETEQMAIEAWNDRPVPATVQDEKNYVKLSSTALLHIHRELERMGEIKDHISGLLTPITREINDDLNEKILIELNNAINWGTQYGKDMIPGYLAARITHLERTAKEQKKRKKK